MEAFQYGDLHLGHTRVSLFFSRGSHSCSHRSQRKQHTDCGLVGVTDDELRERTGADLGFLPIDDHTAALRDDIDLLTRTAFLQPVQAVTGLVYDVQSGAIAEILRWSGNRGGRRPQTSGHSSWT